VLGREPPRKQIVARRSAKTGRPVNPYASMARALVRNAGGIHRNARLAAVKLIPALKARAPN
jgi:hypothetical protein